MNATGTLFKGSTPTVPGDAAGPLRTLRVRPGTFFDAWTRDPRRFGELLPDPFTPGAFARAGTARPADPTRTRAAEVIGATNRAWGADAGALASAERLARPKKN
jgi:hypothetical protein